MKVETQSDLFRRDKLRELREKDSREQGKEKKPPGEKDRREILDATAVHYRRLLERRADDQHLMKALSEREMGLPSREAGEAGEAAPEGGGTGGAGKEIGELFGRVSGTLSVADHERALAEQSREAGSPRVFEQIVKEADASRSGPLSRSSAPEILWAAWSGRSRKPPFAYDDPARSEVAEAAGKGPLAQFRGEEAERRFTVGDLSHYLIAKEGYRAAAPPPHGGRRFWQQEKKESGAVRDVDIFYDSERGHAVFLRRDAPSGATGSGHATSAPVSGRDVARVFAERRAEILARGTLTGDFGSPGEFRELPPEKQVAYVAATQGVSENEMEATTLLDVAHRVARAKAREAGPSGQENARSAGDAKEADPGRETKEKGGGLSL